MACNRSSADFLISSSLFDQEYEQQVRDYGSYLSARCPDPRRASSSREDREDTIATRPESRACPLPAMPRRMTAAPAGSIARR